MRISLPVGGMLVGILAVSAGAQEAPQAMKELEGIEAKCTKTVASTTWDTVSNLSWTQLANVLFVSGAGEAVAIISDPIRKELRGCFVEVYRAGIEEGKRQAGDEPVQGTTP